MRPVARNAATFLAIAGLLGSAHVAHAQASTTRACLDAIPDSALSPEVVYLVATVRDGRHAVRPFIRSSFDLLAQDIAERLRLPDDSASRARSGVPDSLTWRDIDGEVLVTVRRDGTFSARAKADSSGDGVARSARGLSLILRATNEVARSGEVFPWDADQEEDSLTFPLTLEITGHGRDGVMRRLTSRMAFPVFMVRAPWSDEVRQIAGIGRHRYPDGPRQRGYEAEIRMRFTVDTSGRAVDSTIHEFMPDDQAEPTGVNQMMYSQFVAEVRRAIPTLRFHPGTLAGCVVPVRVQQPFTFSLEAPP